MNIARLNNKVAIGERLSTQNVFITGVKLRGNGKEKESKLVSRK
jgi:hypothetical protein